MGAFLLPFGLLSLGIARLPWRGRMLTWLWGLLVATAAVFAAIGVVQWWTRNVFWNPRVIVENAYAPFFRVNSVFWDRRSTGATSCSRSSRASPGSCSAA